MAEPGLRGVGFSLAYGVDALHELQAGLDAMAGLGVDSVEIFLPALAVVVGGGTRPRALAEMRRICADAPCALTLHGPLNANLGRAETARLDHDLLRAGLEVAREIGATIYVQHGAIADDPANIGDVLAREQDALAAAAREIAASGCVVAVETMFSMSGGRAATPKELADQIAAIGSDHIGACVDFSHAALNCVRFGRDYMSELAALAPHARHLHMHDCFGRWQAFDPWSPGDRLAYGFGDTHLPPGAGALPWAELAGLDWRGPALVNLELGERFRWEWADSVRFARDWIGRAERQRRTA